METSTAARSHSGGGVGLRLEASPRARRRGVVLGQRLWVADGLAGFLAGLIASLLVAPGESLATIVGFAVAVAALWTFAAFSLGLYRGEQLASWASALGELPAFFVALVLLSWPVLGIAWLFSLPHPALLTLIAVALIAGLDTLGRTTVRARIHRAQDLRQRTLVLGSGVVAGQLVKKLRNNDQYGLVPVGIVDDEVHDVGGTELPWLGRFDQLGKILESENVDRVIIAFSRAGHVELLEAIRTCRDAGVAIDVVPRLFEFLDGARSLDQVGGLPLISMGPAHLTRTAGVAKRIVDVAGSAMALLVFSPVLIAIAIAIKLESRGPVFFRQERAGRNKTAFKLLKFRSMYVGSDQRKDELEEQNEAGDGVMFKIRDDPRVTRVGKFLRRTSIDELPQLANVLRGEMSLVGPRPLIFEEAEELEDWHLRRVELRPGLTGPWQIYGRSQSPFQEMVRFDYQYVAGWSLARDIEILLATLPAVLSGRGAY
ncbi:MAG TPA: sugar transferase [Solirubrobacterales bacterium]|jgi:exopolysaccharide biosynthesis polyprenyl glycosylphosphotransferase